MTDIRDSKLRGKYGTITKRCVLLVTFLTVPHTNNLIVNNELTKIAVIIRINLKWHNLDYSSRQVVGRPHLKFAVTNKQYIPWVQFVLTPARIGLLCYYAPKF